jgi:hypothetical protein
MYGFSANTCEKVKNTADSSLIQSDAQVKANLVRT